MHYAGKEPATTRPVDELAQAAAYAQAMKLAYCQSNVAGILLFHARDETGLSGWQSGLYYPDGTPKSSLGVVRDTMDAIASGALGKCAVAIKPVVAFAPRTRTISLRCDRDCVYRARLVRLPAGSITAWKNGRSSPGSRQSFQLGARVAPGLYKLSVTFVHATRPGIVVVRSSAEFPVRSPLAALALAGCGASNGNGDEPLLVGAVDDAVRHPGPTLGQLQEAGFGAVGITSFWQPGLDGADRRGDVRCWRTSPRGPARRGSSSASTTPARRRRRSRPRRGRSSPRTSPRSCATCRRSAT